MPTLKLSLALALALTACRNPENTETLIDNDGDGFYDYEDCNDADPAIFPGAAEACNGVDDDCDQNVDEDATDGATWFLDADGDTYGNASVSVTSCGAPGGYVDNDDDCNDGSPDFHPGAVESDCTDSADYNCDGSTGYADADGDGFPACQDCNDDAAAVNPDAAEVCDDLDNDCDATTDEAGAIGEITWFADDDHDGYGDPLQRLVACDAPEGYVNDGQDCNDSAATAFPGGVEECDGLDNDCDGELDDNASDALRWYADGDGDGYGSPHTSLRACEPPTGFVINDDDCNDSTNFVNPQSPEICDDLDNDCDNSIDEGLLNTYYQDGDGDGYGKTGVTTRDCEAPAGYSAQSGDCNDSNPTAWPAAPEACDDIDNDCDGTINEGINQTWYLDADADGYGKAGVTQADCEQPAGYSAQSGDCNDGAAAVNPGEAEVCDNLDNDCDATIDEGFNKTWYIDYDGDGYGKTSVSMNTCNPTPGWVATSGDCNDSAATAHPGGAEVCDTLDNDCDGLTDDADSSVNPASFGTWNADGDGDGFGDPATEVSACVPPAGSVGDDTDCDDTDDEINPDADEDWYDGVDQDCDGDSDNDQDGDGYDAEEEGGTDCDDQDEDVHDTCDLYSFSSHTFSNCGVTGYTGPTLAQCRAAYGTTWDESSAYFDMSTQGIQLWTVPDTGTYRISAFGAAGQTNSNSHTGGPGAMMQGDFALNEGEVIAILVGQMGGSNAQHGNENGGGGGSFVVHHTSNTPLLIAGGGGGAPSYSYSGSCSRTYGYGLTGTSGKTVSCAGTGTGGSGGNGGESYNVASSYAGGAGGGFNTSGESGWMHCSSAPGGGTSYLGGGNGGYGYTCYSPAPHGGFGGGGAGGLGAPGGGGGYSGGGAAGYWSTYADYGGGGGSYNLGTNQLNTQGANAGNGYVVVTML